MFIPGAGGKRFSLRTLRLGVEIQAKLVNRRGAEHAAQQSRNQ